MPSTFWPRADLDEAKADNASSLFDEMVAGFEERHQKPDAVPEPQPAALSFSFDRAGLTPWAESASNAVQSGASAVKQAAGGLFDRMSLMPWQQPEPAQQATGMQSGFTPPSGTPSAMPQISATGGGAPVQGGPAPVQGGDLEAYTRAKAQSLGIDPDMAIRVGNTEGGFADPTRQNMGGAPAYGPFQMFIGGPENPGLGDELLARGIDPRDPKNVYAAIDYALEHASKNGWGAFQGAAAAGIGDRDGIGQNASIPDSRRPGLTTPPQAEQTPAAQAQAPSSLSGITPEQFGLGDADAEAICGPVLAMAFAKSTGRNPTIAEAKQMAAQNGGWTSAQGMGGPEAMANTLRSMGIAATYKPGALDVETIRRETQNGNPVGINTAGHYFVVEGVDAQGNLDLGNSAKALRASGGRQWFRPEEIEALGMGAPTGAIYKDSPNSPTPSVAAAPNAAPAPQPAAAVPSQSPVGAPAPAGAPLATASIGAGSEQFGPNSLALKGFGQPEDTDLGDGGYVDPDSGPRESGYTVNGEQVGGGAFSPASPTGGTQSSALVGPDIQIVNGGPPPADAQWTPVETTQRPQVEIADGRITAPTPGGDWRQVETAPKPAANKPLPLYDTNGQIVGYVQGMSTDQGQPPDPDQGPREATPGSVGASQLPQRSDLSALPADEELAPRTEDNRPYLGPEVPVSPAIGAVQNARAGMEADQELAPRPAGQTPLGAAGATFGQAIEDVGQKHDEIAQATAARRAAEPAPESKASRTVRDAVWAATDALGATNRVMDVVNTTLLTTPQATADAINAALEAAGLGRSTLGVSVLGQQFGVADVIDLGPLSTIGTARGAGMMIPAAGRQFGTGVAGAIERGTGAALGAARRGIRAGAGAVGDALAANAERTAAADARMAEQGSTVAGGTLGVTPGGAEPRIRPSVMNNAAERGMPTLYHETDPRSAFTMLNDDGPYRMVDMHVTPDPDFALGQGGKGAIIELGNTEGIGVIRNRAKPGLQMMDAAGQGSPEWIVQSHAETADTYVRSITIKPDAKMDRVSRALARQVEQDGWTVEHLPDGSRRFVAPEHPPERPQWTPEPAPAATHTPVNATDRLYSVLDENGDEIMAFRNRSAAEDLLAKGQNREPWQRPLPRTPTSIEEVMVSPPSEGGGTVANATTGITPGAGAQALTDVSNSLGGSVFGAASGAAMPADSEEERRQNALRGAGIGLVGGPLAGRAMRRGGGAQVGFGLSPNRPANQAASASPNPIMQRMARQMAGQHTPSGIVNRRGLAERWAQAMTDDRAGIRNFQEAVSSAIGRPLTAGESVAELTRVNPASVASQRLDDAVKPALQRVGDDEDYLAQYLVHSHNVDVAREIGQRAYDDAIKAGATPQAASRRAMAAANQRKFSGDLTLPETAQQLQEIEQRVRSLPDGDDRWQAIQDGAQAVWDLNRKTLERKKDAGIISDALYNDLTTKYPKYVRTDIADYFDKGSGGPAPAGRRLGVSDIGVQKISNEGTTKERVNPLLSMIDQTYSAESAIARNEAGKAFEELLRLDPAWQSTFKEVVPAQGVNVGNPATTVPGSYTLKNGEQFLRVWDGGQARTYVIPPEYAALVAPQVPGILNSENLGAKLVRGAMDVYKSLITSKNPAFSLVVSPIRDAGDYAIREGALSAKSGGARGFAEGAASAVGAMGDYVRAVPDAFAGILEGTYKGDLARMMREGAGQGGRPRHDQRELRNALRDLQRTNGLEVKSAGDAMRLIGNVLTLGAEPIGGRLEQVPRLAAARRAAKRGASDLGQAMSFRDATVDFQRGGEWSRAINTVVPFFNVAMQGGAQTVRTFRSNPAAFMGAVASTLGTATLASEAWNNSDPQRKADYDDLPDYLKKSGIIFMLPGVEGTSERGDRLPNYAWFPVGQYGALVQTAKEAGRNWVEGKSGTDLSTPRGWAELGAEVAGIFSPIRGDSAGAAATSLIPPGLSTAADLAADKDLYRGSTISTDRRDEQASALSQGSASAFNTVTGQETRPSQWEHLYRDLGGYAATLATEGSNLVAEKAGLRRPKDEDRPIQNAPVVGGLVNRIVRDSGGQRLQDATEDSTRVPDGIRSVLEDVGLRREEITPVGSKYKGAQLTREEQERWQDVTNSLIQREINMATRSAEWRARGADRQKLITEAVSKAKQQAAERVLRRLNDREIDRRIRREETRKAS